MTAEEQGTVRKVLQYLKVMRGSGDHAMATMMIEHGSFYKNVLKPLEAMADWNDHDEAAVREKIEVAKEETKGHTLSERSKKIKKLIAVGTITAGLALAAGGVHHLVKTNNKKKGSRGKAKNAGE